MATVTTVILSDSLDERIKSGVETVTFFHPVTGAKMEIELGEANRGHFANHLQKLDKYFAAATVVETPVKATKPAPKADGELAKVRKWAQENGYAVGDRGRIKAEIVEAYKAAQTVTVPQVDTEPVVEVESAQVVEPTDAEILEVAHEGQDAKAELSDAELLELMAELDKETGGNFTVEDVAAKVDNA